MPAPTVTLPYPLQGRPGGTMGPASAEQWANDFAMHYSERLANGTLNGPEGTLFTNDSFSQFGLTPFEEGDIGSGVWSQQAYNKLLQLGMQLANGGYSRLTPQQRQGLTDPTGLTSQGNTPVLSDTDKNNVTQISEGAANRAADVTKQTQADKGAMDRAQLAATVDRERIAAEERNANADRTSREGIANKDRVESGRQFDLRIAEDRRKTTVETLTTLLDRGVELMKNPVDWIAYQFYLEEMNIPLNALTMGSAIATFGAIPPTGPSEVGPVIGGAMAIDGDHTVATQLGIQNPGPISLQQAVQMNPGGTMSAVTGAQGAMTNSMATVQRLGGMAEVENVLNESRKTTVQQAFPGTPFAQASMQVSQPQQPEQIGLNPSLLAQQPGMQQGQQQPGGSEMVQTEFGMAAVPPGQTPPNPMAAPGQPPAAPSGQLNQFGRQIMPEQPTGANVAGNGAAGGIYTGNEAGAMAGASAMGAPAAPGQTMTSPGMPAPQGTPGQQAQAQGQPVGSTNTGPVQIEQILAQLSAQLGIPIDQLRKLFPANLMGQQASSDVLANSPIIQSLRNQTPLGGFNTGAQQGASNGGIGSISIPGQAPVSLGIRGGQDINAANYLSSTPGQQQLTQGAVQSARFYWPDALQQMLRASPVTSLDPGFSARRAA